ncbi:MAG TPA: DNA ligase D [Candidatus Saccharimonadales bacterium]|nr:DNA ligase D [Candidatus Saccharimonadales bacterium]
MGLGKYTAKRNFTGTPEPKGAVRKKPGRRLAFVVQEHHASQLHYDFRLEMDGVLKSWAVPKGPSLNPHEHHLAMHVEDHPYEYRTFEGVIPEGNYGAGNVIIWDEGWYEPRAETTGDPEKLLLKELKKGHITFVLHGKKLHGEFALIKMEKAGDDAWLLIKKGDEYATTEDILAQDESVKSHKRVDDLGAANKIPPLTDYPKKASPWQVKPMLSTLVEEPFSREGWLFEIKWDGYRAVGSKKGSSVALYSRNGLNFAEKYPPIAEALHLFKHDVIVDGEIVVVDENGAAHFEWLQHWNKLPRGSLHYYLFDILWCDGHDIRGMPLLERKKILSSLVPHSDVLHISDHVETKGERLFEQMKKSRVEGMVAKKAASPYREGVRGGEWLKIKTGLRQEVVIGGYTEPRAGRKYLGSLVVGVYEDGNFVYTGHSGGGIPDDQRRDLRDQLAKLERKTSPFTVEPKPNAPVHWVKPALVCEMSFSEWTMEGYMRHPQFEGLRPDKKPTDVHREKPKAAEPAIKGKLELTHLDKIFFPRHKYTKGDLIRYYTSVADYILPYIKDRPCSMNRMPNGITGDSFYQKNNDHLPDWVPHADIFSESNNANLHWIVGGKLDTLLYMVQLGCVEINPWNSRVDSLDNPDWIVIDLDPDGVSFKKVIEVTQTVKEVCDEWKIAAYPKTSGKTGIHIYIPMHAKYTYEQAKNLAHLIVLEVNRRQPSITSVERMPEKRKNKIYLDFLQNREGQTLAAPYSVRPTPDASVSMPLHWDEIIPTLKPTDFTIQNALSRLKQVGDLWKPVLGKGVDLAAVLKRIE